MLVIHARIVSAAGRPVTWNVYLPSALTIMPCAFPPAAVLHCSRSFRAFLCLSVSGAEDVVEGVAVPQAPSEAAISVHMAIVETLPRHRFLRRPPISASPVRHSACRLSRAPRHRPALVPTPFHCPAESTKRRRTGTGCWPTRTATASVSSSRNGIEHTRHFPEITAAGRGATVPHVRPQWRGSPSAGHRPRPAPSWFQRLERVPGLA